MKEKVGIYFLGIRRLDLLRCHLPQLAGSKYDDFHFYLLSNQVEQQHIELVQKYLPNRATIVSGFDTNNDYMAKIHFAISQPHQYSIKMDEDCILLSKSWDRFFALIDGMTDKDLFCTGAISNGIPGCDFFIKNFVPEATTEMNKFFEETKFDNMGFADYSSINADEPWDYNNFYRRVDAIKSHFKGIHPVRRNFTAAYRLNDYILSKPIESMTPIDSEIIRDTEKYPYFCNSFFAIKTVDWKTIVTRRDLFVDPFEEVPLNRYRHETKRNMVMDTGIPILHTMYNWSQNWEYENNLIERLIKEYGK